MGVVQGICNLVPPAAQLSVGELFAAFHAGGKVIALEVLHHHAGTTVNLVVVVHLPDVGMVEFHRDLGLVAETLHNLGVTRQVVVQNFHRCRLLNLVFSVPHLCHAAFPQRPQKRVVQYFFVLHDGFVDAIMRGCGYTRMGGYTKRAPQPWGHLPAAASFFQWVFMLNSLPHLGHLYSFWYLI